MARCHAQHRQTAFAKKKTTRCPILFGTARAVPRGGKFLTCPGSVLRGGKFPTCRELTLLLRAESSTPAAACSSPADSATGGSWTNRGSLVSRRMHRTPCGGEFLTCPLRPAPQHLEWLRAEQTAAFCAASTPASPGRRAAAFTPRSGFLRYETPRPRDSPIPEGRSRPPRRWRSMAVVPWIRRRHVDPRRQAV